MPFSSMESKRLRNGEVYRNNWSCVKSSVGKFSSKMLFKPNFILQSSPLLLLKSPYVYIGESIPYTSTNSPANVHDRHPFPSSHLRGSTNFASPADSLCTFHLSQQWRSSSAATFFRGSGDTNFRFAGLGIFGYFKSLRRIFREKICLDFLPETFRPVEHPT